MKAISASNASASAESKGTNEGYENFRILTERILAVPQDEVTRPRPKGRSVRRKSDASRTLKKAP